MALTDTAIKAAKPKVKPYKLSDGGGLHLLLTPSGSKLWRLQYRHGGKQKLLAFGAYPHVTLATARTKREEAKRLLAQGFDPSARARLEKLARHEAATNTFATLADEYLAKLARDGKAAATLEKNSWLLNFARPLLSSRPISEISAAEVLAVLRHVEKRGTYETARRLRSIIGSVFRYAIATARAQNDPTFALRGALSNRPATPRAAITDPKAFGALLRAIDGFDGRTIVRYALQLSALLFPRPGELRLASWSEFDFENAVWIVPAERMKMRRPHRVPLASQSLTTLAQLAELTGRSGLILPNIRSRNRPISENTVNAGLRALGYRKDQMTAHGFRATASTLLNESGRWSSDAIERQLSHAEVDDVRRAYARGEYWRERVRMMQWWADYLDGLKAVGVVTPLVKQSA